MSRMTVGCFGVLVFAICLSAQQVASNNSTGSAGNSTSHPNTTTTMATGTFSTNSTSPTGAGVSLHPQAGALLIPVVMAASLLQRYC